MGLIVEWAVILLEIWDCLGFMMIDGIIMGLWDKHLLMDYHMGVSINATPTAGWFIAKKTFKWDI